MHLLVGSAQFATNHQSNRGLGLRGRYQTRPGPNQPRFNGTMSAAHRIRCQNLSVRSRRAIQALLFGASSAADLSWAELLIKKRTALWPRLASLRPQK